MTTAALDDLALVAKILDRCREDGDCWVWTGATNAKGYGRVRAYGAVVPTHRQVFKILRGPIPDDLDCDHLCFNRACANPWHIDPVSREENGRRAQLHTPPQPVLTYCHRGHEFTAENTVHKSNGRRGCRTCQRLVQARRRQE